MAAQNVRANREIIANCEAAPKMLQRAWGHGGNLGRKKVEEWDKWFKDLAYKIIDLKNDGHLAAQAENAALDAILALKKVPHWEHPDDISFIRSTLRGDQVWGDYPEKRTVGFEESDDDM